VFERLLGPRYFHSPKGLLARKQALFPITFDGIGVIPTTTITPIAYLEGWVLITLIIVTWFMVDHYPFLLEALVRVDNNTFSFQQHFKVACDLLPPPICICFLLFEQFIKQQMVQVQYSISKHLHHHTLSNMFSDKISEAHHARILSCFGPRVGAWLTT
jgi:hypothetical protein